MTPQEGPWFGVAAAAQYLDMSTRRIYDLTQHGDLTAKQDGRRPKYSRQELDRYANSLPELEPKTAS